MVASATDDWVRSTTRCMASQTASLVVNTNNDQGASGSTSTSSERFRETFHQVNVKFGECFARLFRGGEAQMRLFDEEDILDTGIEIIDTAWQSVEIRPIRSD